MSKSCNHKMTPCMSVSERPTLHHHPSLQPFFFFSSPSKVTLTDTPHATHDKLDIRKFAPPATLARSRCDEATMLPRRLLLFGGAGDAV